ncbi:MAG: T9SS type A sorting domain-containing protein [Ignavibacteria bacterium]|nr:T9SS type A sorting domain-containing protein [Ignavibacteria bacterium]
MRPIFICATALLAWVVSLHPQSHPTLSGTLKAGGVMSRNMELLKVVEFNIKSADQFELAAVKYTDGSETRWKQLMLTAYESVNSDGYNGAICIRVVDVTNPREPNGDYLRIYVRPPLQGNPNNVPYWANFGILQVFSDQQEPENETFKGDVFLIAWVGGPYKQVVNFQDVLVNGGLPLEPDKDDFLGNKKARFLIINLSRAVALRETGPANVNVIEIPDASARGANYNGSSDPNVYVGYIASDYDYFKLSGYNDLSEQQVPHALNIDQEAGVMTISSLKLSATTSIGQQPFIDAFDMTQLADIEFLTSTAAPTEVVRLSTEITVNSAVHVVPLLLPTFEVSSEDFRANTHEIDIKKIGTDAVRLIIASPGNSKTVGGIGVAAGIVIMDVNYANPDACTISNKHWWPYDSDREYPHRRFTQTTDPNLENNWWWRKSHSAILFSHTDQEQPFILTTDELAIPFSNPLGTPSLTLSAGVYKDGAAPAFLNSDDNGSTSDFENDLRIGSFLRVWNTQYNSGALQVAPRGSGNDDGPLVLYDAPESEDPDDLYYSSIRVLPTTSITIGSVAQQNPGADQSTTNRVGPNTTHRPHVIQPYDSRYEENDNDVLLSAYTQGVRMINLTGITDANPVVAEKGFFDFTPRLSYNDWDPYFYKLAQMGVSSYIPFMKIGYTVASYFYGVWHSTIDFGPERCTASGELDPAATPPVRLPEDEKFIYSMAFGEGRFDQNIVSGAYTVVPQDPQQIEHARNWLFDGGFLVLRYFDQKLGGTITGYTGTNTWSDKSYRTVNLQGDFDVQRDVTIAAGACVQLLPGHGNDPGIFESTSLSTASSRTIYVDGTLNISIPEGDPDGTDIIIDVPIVVRTGGKLNVYKINSAAKVVFKKTVTINSNGSWTMFPAANVELFEEAHFCNGKFTIAGTSNDPVVFTGRRANGSTTARGSFVQGRGEPLLPGSPFWNWNYSYFRITYGHCKDAYFDMIRMGSYRQSKDLEHSTFERTVLYDRKFALVYVKQPFTINPFEIDPAFPPRYFSFINNFDVDDCLFRDMQNLNLVTDYHYRNNGLSVMSASMVNITNSTFDSFLSGAVLVNNRNFLYQASTFIDCSIGLLVDGNSGRVCTSDFAGNEFSSVIYATSEVDYYSNSYDDCTVGVGIYTGGTHWLVDNYFGVYAIGLQNYATTSYLRDRVIAGKEDEYEFGRNNFMSPDDQYSLWNGQVFVSDINVGRGAQLFVDCGYNDFTDYSAYHVYSDGSVANFDASNNRWANGAGFSPVVYQIGWSGTPLNVQGDVEAACALIEAESPCQPIPCTAPGINYPGLTEVNSSVYARIATLQTAVFDTTISLNCRRNLVWEYFQAVAFTDSVQLFTQLQSDLASLAANSSLSGALRSQALSIKGKTHRLLEELDSARIVYSQVLSSYPSQADSIPVNWNLLLLNAIQDTTGHFDSLYKVFTERVLLDLRLQAGTGGFSKASMQPSQNTSSDLGWLSISSMAPNPTLGNVELTIKSSHETIASIEVVSISGGIVQAFEAPLAKGLNNVQMKLGNATAGMYIVRCSARGMTVAMTLVVEP